MWGSKIPDSTLELSNSVMELNDNFQMRLEHAFSLILGKTSLTLPSGRKTPWWTRECREAVKARRIARKLLERRPSSANLKSYLEQNNIAASIIKKSKHKSWEDYISTLTPEVPIIEIWNEIKAIKNSYIPSVYPLIKNNISITDPKVTASIFVKYFKLIGP